MNAELIIDICSVLGTSTNMLMLYVPTMNKRPFSVTVIRK